MQLSVSGLCFQSSNRFSVIFGNVRNFLVSLLKGPPCMSLKGNMLKNRVPRWLENAILGLFLAGLNKKEKAEFDN